jgi:hypothetical protein
MREDNRRSIHLVCVGAAKAKGTSKVMPVFRERCVDEPTDKYYLVEARIILDVKATPGCIYRMDVEEPGHPSKGNGLFYIKTMRAIGVWEVENDRDAWLLQAKTERAYHDGVKRSEKLEKEAKETLSRLRTE